MIVLLGNPEESPLRMVSDRLSTVSCAYAIIDQADLSKGSIEIDLTGSDACGWLRVGGRVISLQDIVSIYTRFTELDDRIDAHGDRLLPTTGGAANSILSTLVAWMEICSARVINRYSAMASNMSKPYQLQLISRHGFQIPETLVTNDPDLVTAFYREYRKVVYKSASSTRSIVRELRGEDIKRLDSILWCPTQFQRFVEGDNVRVHVVGDVTFASKILTSAVDYRYAYLEGGVSDVYGIDLSKELSWQCIELAKALDLPFAGIDLIVTPQGIPVCLEVNPSPAFSYYESRTQQPISSAVAKYLVDGYS
jgi:glutathione synthase/RimK-type ligase-like ATP-grasp enzyme